MSDFQSYSQRCVSLDLGQVNDYSALCILEWTRYEEWQDVPDEPGALDVRHLQRWKLGTPYPVIVADVAKMMHKYPLNSNCDLLIDQTGVGRAVIDLFRQERLRLHGITIVGGEGEVNVKGIDFTVPKRDLVGAVQTALQRKQLRISRKLDEAETLISELLGFKVTISKSANEKFGAREGTNDDLVLACAMACWWVTRKPRGPLVW